MHCSGDISSAFLNSRLIALGTLFISDYIPSLKIHTNCSRKSNCHKFQLFSADGFWKSAPVTEDFVPEGQLWKLSEFPWALAIKSCELQPETLTVTIMNDVMLPAVALIINNINNWSIFVPVLHLAFYIWILFLCSIHECHLVVKICTSGWRTIGCQPHRSISLW